MSMIKIDGRVVSLDSLTNEEKSNVWDIIAKRIGESVTDYVNRHPEDFDAVEAALRWAREHAW